MMVFRWPAAAAAAAATTAAAAGAAAAICEGANEPDSSETRWPMHGSERLLRVHVRRCFLTRARKVLNAKAQGFSVLCSSAPDYRCQIRLTLSLSLPSALRQVPSQATVASIFAIMNHLCLPSKPGDAFPRCSISRSAAAFARTSMLEGESLGEQSRVGMLVIVCIVSPC